MNKERALEYWINRYNYAKDYSDVHWDAEERHEHRDYVRAMAWAIKALEQYTTDVQPFKWVRCEESLPVYDGLVLVADRDNNIRLGIFTETGWLSQFGNPMIPRPKAWAKIPELPEPIKG